MKSEGHKIILWTCREKDRKSIGDFANYIVFREAIMQDKLDYLYLIGCKKKEFKAILEMPKFYFNDIPIIQNNCGNMLKSILLSLTTTSYLPA